MQKWMVDSLPSGLFKLFAGPYLAGASMEDAILKARSIYSMEKLYSTIDLLGEDIHTEKESLGVCDTYLQLIANIKTEEVSDVYTISLKPSSLGIDISVELFYSNLRKILQKATEKNIKVTIDMEDYRYTDKTLLAYKEFLKEFPNLGTVLQSRLFRTEKDILSLKGLKTRIRLCIGIYNEKADVAFTNKKEIKENLHRDLEILLKDGHYVEIATHDIKLIERCLHTIETLGYGPEQVEFQMLFGVNRSRIQKKLMNKGYKIRYYMPFATEWKFAISYLKRRLYENPHMAYYTLKNLVTGG